jgi:hypothetical protein
MCDAAPSYRVLICGMHTRERGPIWPASNTMRKQDALRFARDWLAQFPDQPVRVVPHSDAPAFPGYDA